MRKLFFIVLLAILSYFASAVAEFTNDDTALSSNFLQSGSALSLTHNKNRKPCKKNHNHNHNHHHKNKRHHKKNNKRKNKKNNKKYNKRNNKKKGFNKKRNGFKGRH